MGNRGDRARIDDVAALWVARIDARALSPVEEAELDAWVAADIRHAGALARASAVSAHLDRMLRGDGPSGGDPAQG